VICLFIATLIPSAAFACTVPVFRYALENWPVSPYRMVVLYRGTLSIAEQKTLTSLQPAGVYALELATYDVNKGLPAGIVAQQWHARSDPERMPYGMLLPPPEMRARGAVLWQGVLNPKGISHLKELIYTPLMRRICRNLAGGDSAVWVVLKSQDEKSNQQVHQLLADTLAEIQAKMKLPHELNPADPIYSRPPAPGIAFQFRFSIVESDPRDPSNALLMQTLSALSVDPKTQPGPYVMPVFGRGRALAVLADDDLARDVFYEISSFLAAPCSCRVKALNPGFDLPMPFPWDSILFGGTAVEDIMADLPGIRMD
jgi:hypothetical protein